MTAHSHTSSISGHDDRPMDNIAHKDISRHFFLFCILSLLFHVCILAGWIGISLLQPPDPLISNVVQVDLVSLGSESSSEPQSLPPDTITESAPPPPPEAEPEPEPIQPSPPEDTAPEPPQEPEETAPDTPPEPAPVIQPDISVKSKPENLETMLKKKEKPKKIVKKPLKNLRPKPDTKKILAQARKRLTEQIKEREQAKQKQIAQALERMNQKVQKGQTSGGMGGSAGGGNGRKANDALDLYKMILSSAIRQNWIFNESMTRINQGLEVRLLIKILKSGEIRDITYEKRSGNHYLDDSAKKAIQRANPLPPLPNGMKSYNIGVIFTPRGLQ